MCILPVIAKMSPSPSLPIYYGWSNAETGLVSTITNWRVLEITGEYWRLLEITGEYWRLLEITGDYWRVLEITRDYWRVLAITRDYWRVLEITRDYWIKSLLMALLKWTLHHHCQTSEFQCSFREITRDYWWVLEITRGYRRVLVIIRDYWRVLEITSYLYFQLNFCANLSHS